MSIMKSIFGNTRKPKGLVGKMMVSSMNSGHSAMSAWGRNFVKDLKPESIVDLGCGGGKNISELMKMFPDAKASAIDYSEISVEATKKLNSSAVSNKKLEVFKGDVSFLPFENDSFDLASACETVYFWPGPVKSFKEVHRILKDGGTFLIVNEASGLDEKDYKWTEIVDGMRLYKPDEMCAYLKDAGFSEVSVFRKENSGWIAFLSVK